MKSTFTSSSIAGPEGHFFLSVKYVGPRTEKLEVSMAFQEWSTSPRGKASIRLLKLAVPILATLLTADDLGVRAACLLAVASSSSDSSLTEKYAESSPTTISFSTPSGGTTRRGGGEPEWRGVGSPSDSAGEAGAVATSPASSRAPCAAGAVDEAEAQRCSKKRRSERASWTSARSRTLRIASTIRCMRLRLCARCSGKEKESFRSGASASLRSCACVAGLSRSMIEIVSRIVGKLTVQRSAQEASTVPWSKAMARASADCTTASNAARRCSR
mmetsp:Transcript_126496/g.282791  ORF Transcript_126496/g.282791 Transcript_126496/m.282791 type:complete len:273 (-) Transcript_126496:683-1501(-)